VGWGVEVLVDSLLAAKWPITFVALVHWIVSWGIEMLAESLLAAE